MSRKFKTEKVITHKDLLSDEDHEFLDRTFARIKNRDTLMLELLWQYGMRMGELLALTVQDVSAAESSIMIYGSKGSLDREFTVTADQLKRLLAETKGKNPTDRVFPITTRRLQYIWDFYRPCKKGIHKLRHSVCVRLMVKTNGNIPLVQAIMGHKSINTTMKYMRYVYSKTEFTKALSF
jgi:integrase